jgi:four helix bundle protein
LNDIITWQKARALCCHIYEALKNEKVDGFKDQIQGASVAVNNIAEAFERRNNNKFRQFLYS